MRSLKDQSLLRRSCGWKYQDTIWRMSIYHHWEKSMWLPAWRGTWLSRQGKEKELAEWSEKTTLKKKNQQKKQLATGKARGQRQVYIEFTRECDHTNHFSGQVSYVCIRAKNVVGNRPPVHFPRGLNPVFIEIIFPFTGGWTIAKNWSTNSRKNTCFSWR